MMGIFPSNDEEWSQIVETRLDAVREFLEWANSREEGGRSMRLVSRDDLRRVREIEKHFAELWWAVVVYSCFDSITGTLAVAPYFRQPVDAVEAESLLASIVLPQGSVQHHRTQTGNKGAREAVISACDGAEQFRNILHQDGGFHNRYQSLRRLHARYWGRTTCFDLLIRAGNLGVGGQLYEPEFAYLAESTGPAKGFQKIWGIQVSTENVEQCEALLRGWTERWVSVAEKARVEWSGAAYTPADFENALCIFQDRNRDQRNRRLKIAPRC